MYVKKKGAEEFNQIMSTKEGKRKKKSKETTGKKNILDKQ